MTDYKSEEQEESVEQTYPEGETEGNWGSHFEYKEKPQPKFEYEYIPDAEYEDDYEDDDRGSSRVKREARKKTKVRTDGRSGSYTENII